MKSILYTSVGLFGYLLYKKFSADVLSPSANLSGYLIFSLISGILGVELATYISEPFISTTIILVLCLIVSIKHRENRMTAILKLIFAYAISMILMMCITTIVTFIYSCLVYAFHIENVPEYAIIISSIITFTIVLVFYRSHYLPSGLSFLKERVAIPFVIILYAGIGGYWVYLGRDYTFSEEDRFYRLGILFFFFIGLLWCGYQIYYTVRKRREHKLEKEKLENEKAKINEERKELRRRVHDSEKIAPVFRRYQTESAAEISPRLREELEWIQREEAENIRLDLDKAKVFPSTGVDCLDALILELFEQSRMKKINFNAEINNSFRPLFSSGLIGPSAFLGLLANLVDNAFAAIAKNGGDPAEILIALWKRRDGVFVLEVSDSGADFPDEVLRRFGELGMTTRGDGHGNGIHNILRTLRSVNASFTLERFGPDNLYTKRIAIEFDGEGRLELPDASS